MRKKTRWLLLKSREIDEAMDIATFTKEDCVTWLRNINQTTSGTLEELRQKIRRFSQYPKVVEKLKLKTKRQFSFATSLAPENVPPLSARWRVDFESFPNVTTKIFDLDRG